MHSWSRGRGESVRDVLTDAHAEEYGLLLDEANVLAVPLAFDIAQIMTVFKQALPADVCDPSSLGRIRFCTLLPLATAAVVCRQHGRSGASMAWLRAFGHVRRLRIRTT